MNKSTIILIASGLMSFLVAIIGNTSADELTDPCQPGNDITPICGFASPEDIDVLEHDKVLVVGEFSLAARNGVMRTLNVSDGTIATAFRLEDAKPPGPDKAVWGDPDCPGLPAGFAAHGIHVSRNADGTQVLLAVNHTSRESIEWFEIERNDDATYAAVWRGCTVVPDDLWINDVARLPDGGFVASHMMPRSIALSMFDRPMNDGVATGYLMQWQSKRGWTRVAGSEGALPNGIAVSPDGKTIYSNHYLANQTVAIDRSSGQRLWAAKLAGAPDNMSITPNGQLLVTMHLRSLAEIQVCLQTPAENCGLPFANAFIDPTNGDVSPIFESGGAPFGSSTVAVQLGDYIYMGAFDGTSIGRIAVPETGKVLKGAAEN